MQSSALVFIQGGVNLLRPQRERGRDKFTPQTAALVLAQRLFKGHGAQPSITEMANLSNSIRLNDFAINFDSDVNAGRTNFPLPVGNTGRTLEAGHS